MFFASPLQLALNLLDFCSIARREGDFARNDYKQHVNECVSWDIQQLTEHEVPSWSELKIANWYSQFDCQAQVDEMARVSRIRSPHLGTACPNVGTAAFRQQLMLVLPP